MNKKSNEYRVFFKEAWKNGRVRVITGQEVMQNYRKNLSGWGHLRLLSRDT